MKALLVGYGKMGRAIEAVLVQRGHAVVRRIDLHDTLNSVDPSTVDIAFEFTAPEAAPARIEALLEKGIPVVSGSTGFDTTLLRSLADRRGVAFMHAANYSIGVAVMRRAAMILGAALEPFSEFEPGIVERHHNAKKDSPSGTAKVIATAVNAGRTQRPADVPIVALRQGGQPGEHTLIFEGPEESLELVHRARSRTIFAQGAVRAGEWILASQRKGFLTFDDFFERRS